MLPVPYAFAAAPTYRHALPYVAAAPRSLPPPHTNIAARMRAARVPAQHARPTCYFVCAWTSRCLRALGSSDLTSLTPRCYALTQPLRLFCRHAAARRHRQWPTPAYPSAVHNHLVTSRHSSTRTADTSPAHAVHHSIPRTSLPRGYRCPLTCAATPPAPDVT